jgi:hypothetical protein
MLNYIMNPSLLRQLWAMVEMTQTSMLLGLNDPDLVRQLTENLQTQQHLDSEQQSAVNQYLAAKLPLIRDMAQSRHTPGYC